MGVPPFKMQKLHQISQRVKIMHDQSLRLAEEEELQRHYYMMGGLLLDHLPIEIFLDILARLPTKTLLSQCSLVSKSWCSLILHTQFCLIQHRRLIENKKKSSVSLILEDVPFRAHYVIDSLESIPIQDSVSSIRFDRDSIHQNRLIVGSCNGLLCLSSDVPDFVVWNPVKRHDTVRLPVFPKWSDTDFVSGFSFDRGTNEYKVICIVKDEVSEASEAEVFSVGSYYWRSLPKVPYLFEKTMVKCNVFLVGALHWLGYRSGEKDGLMVIICFKVGTEEFGEITLPSCRFHTKSNGCSYLGILEECLCFYDDACGEEIEIWIMKQYEETQRSWVKLFNIRHKLNDDTRIDFPIMLKLIENGEVLLLYNDKILGYFNPKCRTFQPILTQQKYRFLGPVRPILHVQSLISPSNVTQLKTEVNSFNEDEYLRQNAEAALLLC